MTQEERKLLLKDLSARFPYGVIININGEDFKLLSINDYRLLANPLSLKEKTGFSIHVKYSPKIFYLEEARPYLRPMSSMTEEECEEYFSICTGSIRGDMTAKIDFYIKHYFDFRLTSEGLSMIEAGLALEAPEGMYNLKEK